MPFFYMPPQRWQSMGKGGSDVLKVGSGPVHGPPRDGHREKLSTEGLLKIKSLFSQIQPFENSVKKAAFKVQLLSLENSCSKLTESQSHLQFEFTPQLRNLQQTF